MSTGAQAFKNRSEGAIFEELFYRQAQRSGLLVIKNYYTCKFTYKGRVQVVKGELDFKLIYDGITGFFDCKSYQNDKFTYSDLDKDQVARAALYNEFDVPSGFIVWFRASNRICFFSGHEIVKKGPGNHFEPVEGRLLGRFERFDLKPLLTPKVRRGEPIPG